MKIVPIKKIKFKIHKDIRIIITMTLFIFAVLIILPLTFLEVARDKINPFDLNNDNIVKKSSDITFPLDGKVKLYNKEKDTVEEIDLEDYIMGVVASEMPASFDEEALKAQAIAARTFYMNKRINPCKDSEKKDAEICDTTHCQVYMSKEERMSNWSKKESEKNWDKIENAVKDTKGQVLTYEGKVLEYPQFFAISSGKTEDSKDVFSSDIPYLKSEDSMGEEIAPKYKTSIEIPINEFVSTINEKYPKIKATIKNIKSLIKINSYTEAGGVKEIQMGEESIKGTEFRQLFSLNSTNFTLNFSNSSVTVNCIGYGHGVGMSQWGANVMAKNGSKYDEILKHYYSGIEIQQIHYK